MRKILFSIYFLLVVFSYPIMAQGKLTRVSGIVTDSVTKEPMPFVNIVFVDRNVGTVTDNEGYYSLTTQWGSDQLHASFVGYKQQVKQVEMGQTQKLNFMLSPNRYSLEEVTISAKRKRYKNKDNPAVALIKKVVEQKKNNRKESLDFYEYDKYEKVEFDINNIPSDFTEKKALKSFKFIANYIDTSKINNKPYLPVFLKERSSKVYYRKSPKTSKEYVSATNMAGFEDYIDENGVSSFIQNMYEEIDVYQNDIYFMTYDFKSPLADAGPMFYKYFILDTLEVNGNDCIKLGFQPRNKQDFAFRGEMYIINDGSYAVTKIRMRVTEDINLNFVNDLQIDQEFKWIDQKAWMLDKDELVIDFNISKRGMGIFGRKHVSYQNFVFNQERDKELYNEVQEVIMAEDHDKKPDDFWLQARHDTLSQKEAGIFTMVDSIQNVPVFKTAMDVVFFLTSGYVEAGPVDIGPFNGFYSFNDIQGNVAQLGGRTNRNFSEKWMLEAKAGYGFKNERWKYSLGAYYFLNDMHYVGFPRHYIKAMVEEDMFFPGMMVEGFNSDNFLLSFKRGEADKVLYQSTQELQYLRESEGGLSVDVAIRKNILEAGGEWQFEYPDYILDQITNSELEVGLRFAPNEKFYQGKTYRVAITTKYPIVELTYTQGFKDVLDADYNYQKLRLFIKKRVFLSQFGYSDVKIDATKLWGDVPLPLLLIQPANQNYSYQTNAFNMMNFMEFVADQSVSLRVDHYFNGFFFNKIPLLKKLKWREMVSFKGVYGSVRDVNDPSKNSSAMLWPTNDYAEATTFSLEQKPYMEAAVGIHNIFKVLQVTLVRRLNYLDNPNVEKYGIRTRFIIEF